MLNHHSALQLLDMNPIDFDSAPTRAAALVKPPDGRSAEPK